MNRKIIIIILILILILSGISLFIYFRVKNQPAPEVKTSLKQGILNELFAEKMKYPALSSDEQYFLFYLENDGLYRRNVDGGAKSKVYAVNKIEGIIWSPDKTKAIIKKDLSYNFFDLQKKRLIPLNQNVINVQWTERGEKIVYHYSNPASDKDSFVLANPDGSDWKTLVEINPGDYQIISYQEGKIIYLKTITDYRKDLMLYDKQENLLLENTISALVSPWGQIIAINYQNKCFQIDSKSMNKTELRAKSGINKVTISLDGKLSFLASPQDNNKPDKFFKINFTDSSEEEIIYETSKTIQAIDLMVTKDNNNIYFLSEEFIYKLAL